MARPRVFISSTYYDLKNIRADLERFIRERGYEPVLNERGNIPYGSDERLEEYCYKEIELCDILISIIGGRYGNQSGEKDYSISQKELKTALDLGRPIYIFIEKNVLAEHRTYEKNKEVKDFQCVAVDDMRIYKFLDEVLALPFNNPIAPFETSGDISKYLQEQWSGLFQRLLRETSRQKEVHLLEDMKSMISTLKQLVTFLTSEKTKGDLAIRDILLSNHPIFEQLRKLLKVPYRIFFTNLDEFNSWISQRGFDPVKEEHWDDPKAMEWGRSRKNVFTLLKISKKVFEKNGKLRIYTPEEWDSDLVTVATSKIPPKDTGDELPPF